VQYRALAQIYHPDKHNSAQTELTHEAAAEYFKLINNANSYFNAKSCDLSKMPISLQRASQAYWPHLPFKYLLVNLHPHFKIGKVQRHTYISTTKHKATAIINPIHLHQFISIPFHLHTNGLPSLSHRT
jgi:hypothetical protein